MKTQILAFVVIAGLHSSQQAKPAKPKRGSLLGDFSFGSPVLYDDLNIAHSGWTVSTGDFNLNVDLPPPKRLTAHPIAIQQSQPQTQYGLPPPINIINSNSLNKPVIESQEYIPPQSQGTAILPQQPVPAIPVNALASNVPASRGAVFLGSGSIGAVNLGNGAYALGSGSIGYSENRSRPRPTIQVPNLPPIQASPNLLPAAVPTAEPLQPIPFTSVGYGQSLNVPQVPQFDQNGYEYLPPNRVGFGDPLPPRPLKTRQQFATPTALQLQPQVPQLPSNLQFSVPVHGYTGVPSY